MFLVTIKKQVFLAASIWSVVGIFLFLRGLLNIIQLTDPYKYLWLLAALFLGLIKAKVVLEKNAQKISNRILSRQNPSSILGFLPLKSWLLIGSMVAFGFFLRHSSINRSLVWSIYIAIGAALFASSRIFWSVWKATE